MTSTIRLARKVDPIFAEKGKSENKLRNPINGIHMTRSQRIQRGTNRPSGKRDKNRAARTLARKKMKRADHCHSQGLPSSALIVVPGLLSTSMSETSNANQSLDFPHVRQKITTPIPNHTNAEATTS